MSKALAAGGSSLSIYQSQSIVLSKIFSGYGLGLWGAVDGLTAVVLAVAVTAGLMASLLSYQSYAKLGPFERLLRRITYSASHP